MALHIKQRIRNRYIFIIDMLMIVVCIVFSFLLRFEFDQSMAALYMPSAYWMLGISLVLKPIIYIRFGLYRHLWAYASVDELRLILLAVVTASASVFLLMLGLYKLNVFIGFPRSVPIIDFALSLLAVGGIRLGIRMIASHKTARASRATQQSMKRVLIIGAGEAGVMVCKEMIKNPQLHLKPVGFLDDDTNKINQEVQGVRVLGLTSSLDTIIDKYYVDTVLFAIPSAPGRVVRLVSDVCRKKDVPFQTMPGIYQPSPGSGDHGPAAPGSGQAGSGQCRPDPAGQSCAHHRGRRLDRTRDSPADSPLESEKDASSWSWGKQYIYHSFQAKF